jgi:hypothetical protein
MRSIPLYITDLTLFYLLFLSTLQRQGVTERKTEAYMFLNYKSKHLMFYIVQPKIELS